jgi:hypothetical protein
VFWYSISAKFASACAFGTPLGIAKEGFGTLTVLSSQTDLHQHKSFLSNPFLKHATRCAESRESGSQTREWRLCLFLAGWLQEV